jgi:hypothetical protein
MKTARIDQEVIRTKGDYVVGRKGRVIEIDTEKNRVRVNWYGNTKTWVSLNVIEATEEEVKPYTVMYHGVEVEAINFGPLQ